MVTINNDRDNLLTEFGKATLRDRYLLPGESYQGLFARVATYYGDDEDHAQRLYDYMSKHWFMPSTPILANGGADRGYPISCFLNSVDDNLESINEVWSESMWLAARGGGIGTSWSNVRSVGEPVGLVGKTSGVIPFIKVQDSMTLGISQGSLRRGSSAAYLDISHPEIEEFIDIRRKEGDSNRRSLNLHHGVTISDAFMEAVDAGLDWDLKSPKTGETIKTLKARDLWQRILITRVETGEPYIIFSDTVRRHRPLSYQLLGMEVTQSNLCSEIALTTGPDHLGNRRTAVCCLSSLNVLYKDEWFGNEQFLEDILLFLDNVIQDFINKTEGIPGFEAARYAAERERSIGLGVMGFVSYLQDNLIPVESAMAKAINLRVWRWLKDTADKINAKAAADREPCPDSWDAWDGSAQPDDWVFKRWSHMFSVAPTASISIIAGGCTPSVEPHAANVFTQKTLSGSFEVRNPHLKKILGGYYDDSDTVWKSIIEHEGSVQHLAALPKDIRDVFKTWFEVDQRWMLEHAADRAPFICQMASNNLAIAADVHKRDLHQLHFSAWKRGIPSLYYLRSRSLQRAAQPSHMSGEMPIVNTVYEEIDYDECLACQ